MRFGWTLLGFVRCWRCHSFVGYIRLIQCVITCKYGKGPMRGWRLWYQFSFGVNSIITKFKLFLAKRCAQWRACWALVSVCAYLLPCHLCWNSFPTDPNTTSLINGEWNCLSVVEHVIGDEKYKCGICNELVRCSRMPLGSVYCETFRSFIPNYQPVYTQLPTLNLWYNHATTVSNGWVGVQVM